jgi:dihydrofolate reductase
MRKLIMAINVTADGFCDHSAMVPDEELLDFFSGLLRNADTMLYGRKTFELMYPYWPTIAREKTGTKSEITFAELLDEKEKIVFSKQGITTTWQHTEVLNNMTRDEIIKLKEQDKLDILIGGIDIADQLAEMQLIDEYYFVIHPVLYGKGKQFFESFELSTRVKLDLFNTQVFKSGVVALFYRVANWNF